MKPIQTVEEMFLDLTNKGFIKDMHEQKTIYHLPEHLGQGKITVYGHVKDYYFIQGDYTFYKKYINYYRLEEQFIELSNTVSGQGSCFNNEGSVASLDYGLSCHINIMNEPFFINLEPHLPIQYSSFIIREHFIRQNTSLLEDEAFLNAVRHLNAGPLNIPSISGVISQLQYRDLDNNTALLYLKSKVYELLSLIMDYAYHFKESRSLHLSHYDQQAIRQVETILETHLVSPPTIAQLATTVGLNTRKLKEGFKSMTNKTIYEYVRMLRMNKALTLLEDDELTITAISQMIGYSSQTHFYKTFRETFGITPNQMRSNLVVS